MEKGKRLETLENNICGESFWRRTRKRIWTVTLAAATAACIVSAGGYKAFAADNSGRISAEYSQADNSEGQLTKGYDDLSDILQNGGLGISHSRDGDAAVLASTYDETALEDRLIEGLSNCSTEINVADLGLTKDDISNGVVWSIINAHPEIIGIKGGYSYYSSGNNITKLVFDYVDSAKQDQQKLNEALDEIESNVDISGMTDEEIVLAYHEYLTSTVAYAYEAYLQGTLGSKHEYDMYGALVNHSAVCQGYAETMFYLLKKAGLSCAVASSQNINHAWNIVKINGKWYHIDATWDDPVWDAPGKSLHKYFLVSFATMNSLTSSSKGKDRSDMVVSAQWGDTYTSATDTVFESGRFWNGINAVLYYRNGYWYSMGAGSSDYTYQINKYKYSTNVNQILYSGSAKWMAGASSYYPGQYGAIYIQGNTLYFSTPDSLNKIDLSGSQVKATEVVNIRSKYNYAAGNNLYGFGVQYGKVVYIVAKSPNFGYVKDSSDSTKYVKDYDEYYLDVCTEHAWDAGKVTKEPTYTADGEKTYTCKNCGATKTEKLDKLVCTEHAWDNGVVTIEPTYTAEGEKVYTCKNCGAIKTEKIDKLVCTEHAWDAGKVTKEPTYTADGEKTYTCKNCGATKIEKIDKLVCTEHAWDAGVVTKKPTYTADGEKTYTCKNCGATKTEKIDKLVCTEHVWDNGVVTVEPTYTEPGIIKYTCTVCGETKYEKLDKLTESECTEHAWDAGKVTKEPTYTADGEKTYTCKNCGETKTEKIDKLVCTEHAWDAGVVTRKPSYIQTGIKTYTCKNCGITRQQSMAKLTLAGTGAKVSTTSNGIRLTWNRVSAADGYKIYRKVSNGGYKLLRTVSGSKTTYYTDSSVKSGVTYSYRICAYKGKVYGRQSEVKQLYIGRAKVKVENMAAGVKLSWNRVAGAAGYRIYRKAGNSAYKYIRTIKSSSVTYVDKTVRSGNRYSYFVQPYKSSVKGTYTNAGTLYIARPALKGKVSGRNIRLSWTRAKGARQYRIYRKTGKGAYKLVKTVNNSLTAGWTDTNAGKGYVYYYVQAVNGSHKSAASAKVRMRR